MVILHRAAIPDHYHGWLTEKEFLRRVVDELEEPCASLDMSPLYLYFEFRAAVFKKLAEVFELPEDEDVFAIMQRIIDEGPFVQDLAAHHKNPAEHFLIALDCREAPNLIIASPFRLPWLEEFSITASKVTQ